MTKIVTLYRWRDRLYRIHVVTGLAAAAWFLLMAVTGILINHQESLGLLDAEISDRYLPGFYRPDMRTGTTRLNIIITDLHSGRILGSQGTLMSDLVAVLLIVSLLSGFISNQMKKRLQSANLREVARAPRPSAQGQAEWNSPTSGNGSGPGPQGSDASSEPSGRKIPAR
jgi:hypothetical protein